MNLYLSGVSVSAVSGGSGPAPNPNPEDDLEDPNSSTSTTRGSISLSSPYMGYWNITVMEGDYVPILYTWRDINNKRVTTDYFPLPETYRSGVIITPARFAGHPVTDYFWKTDQGKRVLAEINKAST